MNFTTLVERIERQLGGSVSSERRTHHATHHLAHRQLAADVGFEPFGCQALGADQRTIGFGIERAVGTLQRGDGRDILKGTGQTGVAGDQVRALRCRGKHAVTNQSL